MTNSKIVKKRLLVLQSSITLYNIVYMWSLNKMIWLIKAVIYHTKSRRYFNVRQINLYIYIPLMMVLFLINFSYSLMSLIPEQINVCTGWLMCFIQYKLHVIKNNNGPKYKRKPYN